MIQYARVMVVTDFSPTADAALPHAYALVAQGGEVHMLHLIEHRNTPGPLYAHYSPDELALPEKRAEVVASVESHLRSLIPKDAAVKTVTTVVGCAFHEHIAAGIIEEAHKRKADALAIGSHGRTGLSHLLMGSVTEQVLRSAKMPVLVVPRHE